MRHSRLCGCWPRTTAGASRRLIRTLAGRRRFSLTRPPPSFATAREGQGVFHVLVITEQVPAHPRVQTLRRFLGEPDPEGFGPEPVCPHRVADDFVLQGRERLVRPGIDRKSTRLNSSHGYISYAVFCLKKKNKPT